MNTLIRTANFKKCGSTEFKLEPKVGEIEYICAECNEHVATVEYDDFETVNKECKCGRNLFKAKITEDSDNEQWSTYCSKCSERPKKYYIDEDGYEIDRGTRELLIIRRSIDALNCKVETLESDLNSLDSTVETLEGDLNSLDSTVRNIENEISS